MKSFIKITVILFLFIPSLIFCNDFKETYLDLLQKKEFAALENHLATWEKEKPNDPEMFIAYFNYYIYRDSQSGIAMIPSKDRKNSAQIREQRSYNKKNVLLGIEYLDKALVKYPYRLDIHIGKINMLQNVEEFDSEVKQIFAVIDLIPKYKGKWQWADGKLEKNFDYNFQNDIQNRIGFFLSQEDKKMQDYAKIIAEKMIKAYPKNVWWYNDIAATYYYSQDYQNAIKYFKLAEKIDPQDEIVQFNIGYCYDQLKDKKNALKYYEKLKNAVNENIANKANTRIDELSK